MRNTSIINVELKFQIQNLSSKEEEKSAQQVPRSLPISPASQKKLLQYPFSREGFAEPHVCAQLSFRAGALTDMQHS